MRITSKKRGGIRALQLLLDQSYVQDHVQSYRQDVERDTGPWSCPTDYTVGKRGEDSCISGAQGSHTTYDFVNLANPPPSGSMPSVSMLIHDDFDTSEFRGINLYFARVLHLK